MKVIIDIDEEIYESSKRECEETDSFIIDTFTLAIGNGTPIPDDATNGDVIMAMFPNVSVYEHNGGATYSVNNEYNFNATWWDAPYQKGGKE